MSLAFLRYALLSAVALGILLFVLQTRFHFMTLWAYLTAVNIVGFGLYMLDKLAAKLSWLRVPEKLLHLLAFAGATPAAIVAQQLFWHKTTKRRFQVVFWLIVLLQLLLIYALLFTDLLQSVF